LPAPRLKKSFIEDQGITDGGFCRIRYAERSSEYKNAVTKNRLNENFAVTAALKEIDRVAPRDHFVQFYKAESTLIDCMARFFAVGFAHGDVGIVIATQEHREALEARLVEMGVNVEGLRQSADYSAFDADEMLAHFMVNGRPDARRFRALMGTWLDLATGSGKNVRAFGEMVALLAANGNDTGAIELEKLWNRLAETYEFTLYCAYPSHQFSTATKKEQLSQVCCAHSRVISG
jgi:hypothetical protein